MNSLLGGKPYSTHWPDLPNPTRPIYLFVLQFLIRVLSVMYSYIRRIWSPWAQNLRTKTWECDCSIIVMLTTKRSRINNKTLKTNIYLQNPKRETCKQKALGCINLSIYYLYFVAGCQTTTFHDPNTIKWLPHRVGFRGIWCTQP